ncbi:MAG: MATE family efflux transporter [Chloroflexota bacterium]
MEQTTNKKRTGLTRQVILLAGPLVLQNLSQTLLGVIDTYFVSRISTEAVASVGLASVLYFAVLRLFHSTANSTVVFVGRAHGEGDDEKIGTAVWRSLNMIFWLSLVVLLLPWAFRWIMVLMAPQDGTAVRELGTTYLQIRAIEIPFVMFSGVVWAFLVGRGDSRTPMILAWITVLVNILLDWILVLGNLGAPQLGVQGAAYATVLANCLLAAMSAGILWQRKHREQFKTAVPVIANRHDVWAVMKVGLPIGMGDFIEIGSFSVFFAFLGQLGTAVLAANQIALQFMSISFTFGVAVAMATSSLVAQYLGAKQPDQAKRVAHRAVVIGMISMGLIGLSYLIAPDFLIGLYSDDPTVIEAGVTVLTLVALYQVFDAVGVVLAGALNGAGDTQFTMWTRSILAWGMFLPLVWVLLFVLELGTWGAWMGALIYLGGLSIIYWVRFRNGRWQTIELA